MARLESEHPEHLREAGETIQELRDQQHEQMPQRERIVQAVVARLGRPRFLLYVLGFIIVWVVLNVVLRPLHLAFDTDTFALLNLIAQLFSLVVVLTILSGQTSLRLLEEERDRLTLQLELIIDKKITQTIRDLHVGDQNPELREPTDLHQAAQVLRKAERDAGQDE